MPGDGSSEERSSAGESGLTMSGILAAGGVKATARSRRRPIEDEFEYTRYENAHHAFAAFPLRSRLPRSLIREASPRKGVLTPG
jgi:hypothetical protein